MQRSWLDLLIIVGSLFIGILIGLCMLHLQNMGRAWPAVVCGGAFLAFGALIGFLFGIPRVLQKDASARPAPETVPNLPASEAGAAAPRPPAPSSYHIQVNTNLEQISDWLTKIIVGLGLVELRDLAGHLHRLAQFMAQGLILPTAEHATLEVRQAAVHSAEVLAMTIIVYFSLMGFYGGYLTTRTYLTGAFRRADEENLSGKASAEADLPLPRPRPRDRDSK